MILDMDRQYDVVCEDCEATLVEDATGQNAEAVAEDHCATFDHHVETYLVNYFPTD